MGGVVLTWHSYIPESRCWGKRICKKIEYLKLASVKIINHNIIIDIYLFIITKDGKQSVAFVWQTFSLMAWKDKQRTIDPYKYPPGYIIWGRRNPYFRHRGRLYIYFMKKSQVLNLHLMKFSKHSENTKSLIISVRMWEEFL